MAKIKMVKIDRLIPYEYNARDHSEEQIQQIAASITEFDFLAPIIVDEKFNILAGHGRLQAARLLGMETVPCVEHNHLTEDQKAAYILADNKIAEAATWNRSRLREEIERLTKIQKVDLTVAGFNNLDIERILQGRSPANPNNIYTRKIEAPTYEPRNRTPTVKELYDDSKTKQLQQEITEADIPETIKEFLHKAAERHTVFDFENIADFYAHTTADIQRLMEKSALVIIDFNQAIEYGYISMVEKLLDIVENENG
jgi:hypothetical protein